MGDSIYKKINAEIAELISKAMKACKYEAKDVVSTISLSEEFGDIASSIAFRLAKEYKKNPNTIANEIQAKITKPSYVENVSVKNSYINFKLDRAAFTKLVVTQILEEKETYVSNYATTSKRVMIEYPSVNPNKPWHIGHLRNALLGDSLSKIYVANDFRVVSANYIDDLGLQMGETVWWYLNKNNKVDKKVKFDHWLGHEYVKANEYMKNHDVKTEISKTQQLMEQDGTYESKLARDIAKMCLMAQYQTAFSYKINSQVLIWESDVVRENLLNKAFSMLEKSKFVKKPKEGEYSNCVIVDLNDIKDLPEGFRGLKESVKVLIRGDGTPTYLAKDIAFHMWKFGVLDDTFKYSVFIESQENGKPLYTTSSEGTKMNFAGAKIGINIIDARQSYPQDVLKLAFGAISKNEIAENIRHLAYGEVEVESGGLSGRAGTWIGYSADDLLREAKSKALSLIKSKFNLSKGEQEKIAYRVALAAIKFEFLKVAPETKIVFSWDRALNFEGNSGPYSQYMYARATRILENAEKFGESKIDFSKVISDDEFELVKYLARAKDIVEKAAFEYRPNVLAEYIMGLSLLFAKFYESSPVLKADEKTKVARLSLLKSFRYVIGSMLGLLGIEALEKM